MSIDQPEAGLPTTPDKVVRPVHLGLVTALVIAGHIFHGERPAVPRLPGTVRTAQPTPVPGARTSP